MRFEVTGTDAVASDFEAASAKIITRTRVATQTTLNDIKNDARQFASGMSHLPQYPSTITYETHVTPSGVEGEVGPEKRGQGNLGHLIEHGSPTSGPHAHMAPAADRHVGEWVDKLEDAAGDV